MIIWLKNKSQVNIADACQERIIDKQNTYMFKKNVLASVDNSSEPAKWIMFWLKKAITVKKYTRV